MKSRWFTLLFFLAIVQAVPAQQTPITPQTPVNSSILLKWLHSGDPLQIAWACDFASRTHDASVIAEMPALLEHWNFLSSYGGNESQAAQTRAIRAVLDTLIQENIQVPIPAIEAVAPSFPAQAIILIGRLPLAESRATLNDWTYRQEGNWSGRTLARVASMMLAKDPELMQPGKSDLVSRTVAASEEDMHVTVTSSYSGQGSLNGNPCGDSLPQEHPPGWPLIYIYALVENDQQAGASVVVDLDGDRIAYRRIEEDAGWGTCNGVRWLDPLNRHRLIAYWLGAHVRDMSWQPVEHFSIVWTNKTAYQRQLGMLIESQREKLRATSEALYQRGFLTEGQAATTVPKLVVTIKCDLKPCPL